MNQPHHDPDKSSAGRIQLRGVGKVFETSEVFTHALSGIDLDIGESEYLSIQGASGSGKSTLLNILGLLETPSSGIYEFSGDDISLLSAGRRARYRARHLGFVFQSFNLLGELSVLDNVALPVRFAGQVSAAESRERAAAALDRVGLSARTRHRPHQLSGGQQQRVAIARAIVNKPRLLLADEPTGNLDSATGESVLDLLEDMHRDGTTLVVVTHDAAHAGRAGRRITMSDGKIVSDIRD
jgi:putative ABC transport system ATP-binding protein